MIVTQRQRPPNRLGTAIRYLVENQAVIAELIEKHLAKE